MRILRSWLFSLLLFLPLVGSAQVLYEISGNGCRDRSYLLATNRYIDQTFIDTIPNVFGAFGKASCVITEFTMQDYEAIAALRQFAVPPDSIRLSNFFTPDEYREIDDALQAQMSMTFDHLCRLKPSYLTEMFRANIFSLWLHYDERRTMDAFFQEVAQEKGMPVYGLDDVGETMYMLFDREPFEHQCQDLLRAIRYPERELQLERRLEAMYRMGNLTDIAFLVSGPDNQTSLSFSDYKVYTRRNPVWVKRLHPYLRDGGAFIALDALYLGGDEGLIALLRKAGYRVRPVNRRFSH